MNETEKGCTLFYKHKKILPDCRRIFPFIAVKMVVQFAGWFVAGSTET
jgi:hypothetical protein